MLIQKATTSVARHTMLDGKYANALYGRSPAWLWGGRTTIGSMSLAYMGGKRVLDTFGRLTVSKPPS
jgi:hypothetical protein